MYSVLLVGTVKSIRTKTSEVQPDPGKSTFTSEPASQDFATVYTSLDPVMALMA